MDRYFIHPFGYYRVIFTPKNLDQLDELVVGFKQFIGSLNLGKMEFAIPSNNAELRNQIPQVHNRILQLAFFPHETNIKLQLITLSENLMISLRCYINERSDTHTFLRQMGGINYVSASFWTGRDPEEENQRYRIDFQVDAKSYTQIQARNHQLLWKGVPITIEVINNPYLRDIEQLPVNL